MVVGGYGTILSSKADASTSIINSNLDLKSTQLLCITKVSNRLFIQMPNTKHVGKDLCINLFNTTGRTVYTTNMKMVTRKFIFAISGLSQGIYHAKITSGKSFKYYGSFVIAQ